MSFELKLSRAVPEVQKELKKPGAGRVLRISKGQQGGNCAGVEEGKERMPEEGTGILLVIKMLDFGWVWQPVISATWQF